MKRIKLDSAKLQLRKEKISKLTNEEMSNVQGGGSVVLTVTNRLQQSENVRCSNNCPAVGGTIYINPNPLKGGN